MWGAGQEDFMAASKAKGKLVSIVINNEYIKICEIIIIILIKAIVNMYVFENNFNFFITSPQIYIQFL